jgi:hypothetical protein
MSSLAVIGLGVFVWLSIPGTSVGQQPAPGKKDPLAKDPGAYGGGISKQQQQENPQIAAPAPAPAAKGKGKNQAVAGPAPHLPDGRPDFGGDGAWSPGYSGNIAEATWKGVKSADKHVDVPFLPWALKLFNERVESLSKDDPEARCLPVGVPRYMFDPYPFQIYQTQNRVLFIFEGDNYPWRLVPTDGKAAHPKDPNPTWMGDAVGHYEGDTLVVDVVGFNDKAWLDQAGHPQTEKMHLTERYTRTDSLTLKYVATLDDPGAYSAPWTTSNTVRWRPGLKLLESVCSEGEIDSKHMVGKQ